LLLVLLTSVAILSLLLRAMTIAMLLCYMLHCHKCRITIAMLLGVVMATLIRYLAITCQACLDMCS